MQIVTTPAQSGKLDLMNAVANPPDRLLRFATSLPWPANQVAFDALRRVFKARGRASGSLTRIQFGSVEIVGPLEHPAVYWRYRPVGSNMNYVSLVRSVLKVRSGLVIDVGANIGDSIALLRSAGINSPVLAVEGTDVWFNLLKRNITQLGEVSVEKVFLGSSVQDDGLDVKYEDGTARLIKGSSSIRTITLDELMLNYEGHRVALLKIDTDGFDAKVLAGANKLLTSQAPVVFAEVEDALLKQHGDSYESLVGLLATANYRYVAAWDDGGRWLGARHITQGLADWVASRPGGYDIRGIGQAYIDIAAFTEADRVIFDGLDDISPVAGDEEALAISPAWPAATTSHAYP